MINGIINVIKPRDMTSHDVVGYIRRHYNLKKAGHTGTLDPMAIGVLPIIVGKGTKLSQDMIVKDKQYIAKVKLGVITDTLDSTGKILIENEVDWNEDKIINTIMSFVGVQSQIPPMYSSVKVDGKKLYELARKGQEIIREERQIKIHNIDLLYLDKKNLSIFIKVDCSKGTYIRSLINDIGIKLNCGAIMDGLIRTKSGEFNIKNAYTLNELDNYYMEGKLENVVLPLDYIYKDYKKIVLHERNEQFVLKGIPIDCKKGNLYLNENEVYRVYGMNENFLCISKACLVNGDMKLKMIKSFY